MSPSNLYSVEGGKLLRNRKSCPRCGQGTFLAKHKGRLYCGKCHYTEFEKKGTKPVKETKESKTPVAKEAKPIKEKANSKAQKASAEGAKEETAKVPEKGSKG